MGKIVYNGGNGVQASAPQAPQQPLVLPSGANENGLQPNHTIQIPKVIEHEVDRVVNIPRVVEKYVDRVVEIPRVVEKHVDVIKPVFRMKDAEQEVEALREKHHPHEPLLYTSVSVPKWLCVAIAAQGFMTLILVLKELF